MDKIVKTNDQSCSLLLQQKLRSENLETRNEIFQCILAQLLSLMKNRFGNFLVQCCFDFGSESQLSQLYDTIKGNVIQLSCDRFGCHVMQRAIERFSEQHKAAIILELYENITETFVHRFACHVWQRVFEIEWKETPLNVIKHVQEHVEGKWASIANDENGSLVVQCIFEHCNEQDRSSIIKELFMYTEESAKGRKE